jgi:AcrR family transcriptional regulator
VSKRQTADVAAPAEPARSANEFTKSPVKRRVVEASAKLFARKGYSATGIAEIEKAVGLGRGALYHHIGSKENLLYEISRSHVLDMVEYGEQLALQDLSAEEKFRALARRLMTTIAENLAELTVFFSDHRALSKAHATELVGIRNRFEGLWVAILAQGVERGELRETSPVVVKGVLGMFNYSYLWLRPGGKESPEQIADEFCDVLLTGLKKP